MTEIKLDHKKFILIADDDIDIRSAICTTLQEEGFITFGCSDGLELIKFWMRASAERQLPCLILLDANMPYLSGWDICRLRRGAWHEAQQKIPIYVITGESKIPPDITDPVIKKPISLERLLEVCCAHCPKAHTNGTKPCP